MNNVTERNKRARQILDDMYECANNPEIQIDEQAYETSMKKLFDTTVWGFREILLVVVVAMKLDPSYRASTGLYACKPRAIYEGPIKEFLIDREIPHRKSGPLNIAKATVGLDMTWAAQRSDPGLAEEVVNIVRYMEESSTADNDCAFWVGVSLLRRMIACSCHLEALSIDIEPSADPDFLYHLCYELITKTPDAGNTPQKIVAYILKNYHQAMHTGIVVTGEDDRASVTSTTSKKPGDVNEESASGIIYKVYEVTVKHFDLARIRDSYDCVRIYNESHDTDIHEIIVICRPQDCPEGLKSSGLHGYLGSYAYQDIIYYYWDIFEWISSTLQHMTETARIDFYGDLNTYINDINTAEKVKILWRDLHK